MSPSLVDALPILKRQREIRLRQLIDNLQSKMIIYYNFGQVLAYPETT